MGSRSKVKSVNNLVSKAPTRAKFTCPNCGLNAWAKPDAVMDCHSCSQETGEQVVLCAVE